MTGSFKLINAGDCRNGTQIRLKVSIEVTIVKLVKVHRQVNVTQESQRRQSRFIGTSGLSSRASSSSQDDVKTLPIDLPRAEANGTGTAFPIWRICWMTR